MIRHSNGSCRTLGPAEDCESGFHSLQPEAFLLRQKGAKLATAGSGDSRGPGAPPWWPAGLPIHEVSNMQGGASSPTFAIASPQGAAWQQQKGSFQFPVESKYNPGATSAKRKSTVQEDVDIGEILIAARSRWLKPAEICNILQNFEKYEFQLNQEPPMKPPSGSLYLFDRKVVRYFRKDGHSWRKKKDGKTVREAHEKLKAGSVDILHCYYAHGEENDLFQRRCYWLLDGVNENIVLVHYRMVAQGSGRAPHSPLSQSPLRSPPGSPRPLNGLSNEAGGEGSGRTSSQGTLGNLQTSSGHSGDQSQYATSVSQAQRPIIAPLDEEVDYDSDGNDKSERSSSMNEASEDQSGGWEQPLRTGSLFQQQRLHLQKQQEQEQQQPPHPTGHLQGLSLTEQLQEAVQLQQQKHGAGQEPSYGTPGFGRPNRASWQPTLQGQQGQPIRFEPQSASVELQHSRATEAPSTAAATWNHHNTVQMMPEATEGGGKYYPPERGRPGAADPATILQHTGLPELTTVELPAWNSSMVDGDANGLKAIDAPRMSAAERGGELDAPSITADRGAAGKEALKADIGPPVFEYVQLAHNRRLPEHLQQQVAAQQRWPTVQDSTYPDISEPSLSGHPGPGIPASEALRSQIFDGTGSWLQHDGKAPEGPESLLEAGPWHEETPALADTNMEGDQASVAQILAAEMQLPLLSKGPGTFSGGSMRQFGKNDSFGQWVNEMYDAEGRELSPKSPISPNSPRSPHDVKPPRGLPYVPSARKAEEKPALAANTQHGLQQQRMEVDEEVAVVQGPAAMPSGTSDTTSAPGFTLLEYSPTSCSCSGGTNVLLVGQFGADGGWMNDMRQPLRQQQQWMCRFGDAFVSAEHVAAGVLRCVAPPHTPGAVELVVLSGGEVCTTPVPFQYLPDAEASVKVEQATQMDTLAAESSLEVRLVRLLEQGAETPATLSAGPDHWSWLRSEPPDKQLPSREFVLENLLQVLLRQQLAAWIERHQGTSARGPEPWAGQGAEADRGAGVLHFVAGLGYSWALAPLLQSGISVNALDNSGRTPLHWAAAHGREAMVVALLAAGADSNIRTTAFGPELPAEMSAGGLHLDAVGAPHSTKPGASGPGAVTKSQGAGEGLTAAEIASSQGHAGIAAYLAEIAINASLSTMSLGESTQEQLAVLSAGEAAVAAAAAVKRDSGAACPKSEEERRQLDESMEAVRHAAEAAARIQVAFRRHCQRRQCQDRWQTATGQVMVAVSEDKERAGLTEEQIRAVLAVRRIQKAYRGARSDREQKRKNIAAARIQQRYRGWKGRQKFLLIRNRIIRLQARVKGRIQRKQYQRMRWSIGILAKAVMRWRRKRIGAGHLENWDAGLHAQQQQLGSAGSCPVATGQVAAQDDLWEGPPRVPIAASEAALGVSLNQVQALVVSDEARAQYLRLRHAQAHLQSESDRS